MLFQQLLTSLFVLLLATLSLSRELNNAERFARGLPPNPPKRMYRPSKPGAALAKRSQIPISGDYIQATNAAGTVVGYLGYTSDFYIVVVPLASASQFAKPTVSGANGFTLVTVDGQHTIAGEDGSVTWSSTTGVVDFYDNGNSNDGGSPTRSTSTSIWNYDSNNNLYVNWPEGSGDGNIVPTLYWDTTNNYFYASESAQSIVNNNFASSTSDLVPITLTGL